VAPDPERNIAVVVSAREDFEISRQLAASWDDSVSVRKPGPSALVIEGWCRHARS